MRAQRAETALVRGPMYLPAIRSPEPSPSDESSNRPLLASKTLHSRCYDEFVQLSPVPSAKSLAPLDPQLRQYDSSRLSRF